MSRPKGGIEASGALKRRNRLQRPSSIDVNAAKTGVGSREIRVQGQRNIYLGLCPIEVLFENRGPRRDKSGKRFVRVLFDRLFRIVFR